MGRHSMVEEPAPRPTDGRVSTGSQRIVEAPARRPESAAWPPEHRSATVAEPPTRRIDKSALRSPNPGTVPHRAAAPAANPAPRPGERRVTGGQQQVAEAPTRHIGTPPRPVGARTPAASPPPIEAPTRRIDKPARRLAKPGPSPDGATGTTTSPRTAGARPSASRADDSLRTRIIDSPARRTDDTASRPRKGRAERRTGTATGTHRAIPAIAPRRKIAKWPIVTGVVVLLLAVCLAGWMWASNVLESRTEAQAKECAEGDSQMTVIAAPGIARAVETAAAKWNQAKTVVHAHCVHIAVRAVPSEEVYDALTGKTSPDAIGGVPAAWIPEAADWGTRLSDARPDLASGHQEDLVAGYSYVGLGGSAVDEVAIRAAQVFHDFLLEPAQKADFDAAGLG